MSPASDPVAAIGAALDEQVGSQLPSDMRQYLLEDFPIADEADTVEDYLYQAVRRNIPVEKNLLKMISEDIIPKARGPQKDLIARYSEELLAI